MQDVSSCQSVANEEVTRADEVCGYFDPLLGDGLKRHLLNASAEVIPLALDEHVFPVTVRNWNRGDSNVCSPYTHYID